MEAVTGAGASDQRMTTFFVKFELAPTEHNTQSTLVKGAFAYCWIVEDSEPAAYNKASFYVEKDEWEITRTATFPIEVGEADFSDQDIGMAQYVKAQHNGIAIVYVGWSPDGKAEGGSVPLRRSRNFDLNAYVGMQKRLARKGRCLHFESGIQCGEIISAHSIQKNGQLAGIADNGHVYTVSRNIGTLKKNDGRLTLEKRGMGKVSTFLGFCEKHDSQLFAPIDTAPLRPTGDQVLLYGYRAICRELFVKENALDLIDSQLAELPATSSGRRLFEDLRAGTSFGLKNLRRHKTAFDDCLKDRRYADIDYALFACPERPFLAFSGLIFPEFDFLGRHLQNLADHTRHLDLLMFCSAPMEEGWGFLFAWHKSSAETCRTFMSSLATLVYEDASSGADAMFRMVISTCENLAVSPVWWESLSSEQKNAVSAGLSRGTSIFAPTNPDYLTQGLESLCQWRFETVYTSPEQKAGR